VVWKGEKGIEIDKKIAFLYEFEPITGIK
jgi:hypothetical protein